MSLDVFKTHAVPMATVMNNDIGAIGELLFIFLKDVASIMKLVGLLCFS